MDKKEFRNCMGRFATGVTVVTTETEGVTHGFTVNSFTSVSLDPPIVLVSVDKNAKALQAMKHNNFIANVLNENQRDTAMHFAGKPKEQLPFEWEETGLGARIKGSLAHIECVPWAEYDGGDHVLFLGEVKAFEYHPGQPLAFYCGQFSNVSPLVQS
ncbi:flavin reductase family protein [Tuberibacillus sp. Marseille-P3662]|uniref:flavin reductase family protein n=1 Tax=Tuberibacillus sp. Marseille-P3662 TaxID=1965358 RepID=UPI000A1C8DD3|nr:flavin reductase family protein [Tuberibacillus sp. Marseille-P3662]